MAYGFVPVKHASGGTIRPNEYSIAAAYTTNIFSGDPVALVDGGTIQQGAASSGTGLVGVFYGVSYKKSTGEYVYSRFWDTPTGATEIKAYVYDDPNIIYKVESDQDTTPIAAATVGSNVDFAAGTGSTVTGQSAAYIDSSTNTDGSPGAANFRVLGSAELDGSFTSAGTPMDIYVRFNEHQLYANVTGL